jgi:hypothetical protein
MRTDRCDCAVLVQMSIENCRTTSGDCTSSEVQETERHLTQFIFMGKKSSQHIKLLAQISVYSIE